MSEPLSVDHVAIAVFDADVALEHFRDRLGLAVVHDERNDAAGARLVYLDVGPILLQLVAPLRDDAPVAAWLDEHGEGLHHLCFAADDVLGTAAALATPDAGPVTPGSGRGRVSALVPGAPVHGTRLELTERA
jgi:methylmalonyl-CoA/ethylmalonyl-CoA epimerase